MRVDLSKGAFRLGFKTKENPRLRVHIGQEPNFGPRNLNLGQGPSYEKMY